MIAVSVDETGCIQLPQAIQDRLGLAVSASLSLEVQDGKIILTPIVEEPKIYYEGSLLVVESESAGELDIIDTLREERIQENLAW